MNQFTVIHTFESSFKNNIANVDTLFIIFDQCSVHSNNGGTVEYFDLQPCSRER